MMRDNNLQIWKGLKTIFMSVVFSFLANTVFTQSIPTENVYPGQTPPGNTPKIIPLEVKQGFFAAERLAISNDGRDIYYSDVYIYWGRIDDIIDSLKSLSTTNPYNDNQPDVINKI